MGIDIVKSFALVSILLMSVTPVAFADSTATLAYSSNTNLPDEFVLAEEAMDEQDLNEAAIHYRIAAEQNYLPAQTALGDLMRIAQDYEAAFGWYLTSAYQGDAAGEYALGQAYANGEGVEKNLSKALYWIKHAAEKNYLPAAENITLAYKYGYLGLAKDPDQAKMWESRLIPMRVASQKAMAEKVAALQIAKRDARIAAIKKAIHEKRLREKAEAEAAAKKVDNADVANAKNAEPGSKPSQAK